MYVIKSLFFFPLFFALLFTLCEVSSFIMMILFGIMSAKYEIIVLSFSLEVDFAKSNYNGEIVIIVVAYKREEFYSRPLATNISR